MLMLWLACAPPAPLAGAPAAHPALAAMDWRAAGAETASRLGQYLAVDSSNPPGGELAAAQWMAAVLESEGIPSVIDEYAPGRANLVATLEGGGEPLCLLSHLDVATAEPDRWTHPPFSGAIIDGMVWGRGALDMKGMGVLELQTLVWLKRLGVPLKRDVVLIAVADEEMDNTGMLRVVERGWPGCADMVNEGGIGLKDLLFEGQTVFPISVAEKGVLWLRMVASGEPGHGSTPVPGRAPERLQAALARLGEREPKAKVHPALAELLETAGRQQGGAQGWAMRHPGLITPVLMGNPLTRAAVTDTCQVTGFGGQEAPNVVPSEVWATLDCRVLPSTAPRALLAELEALMEGLEGVRFEVLSEVAGNESEWKDQPFFEAMAAEAVAGRGDAVAGPVLSVGFTDSIYARPLGVRAYGFVPFVVDAELAATMHGDDERVSVQNLEDGLRMLLGAVVQVSAR